MAAIFAEVDLTGYFSIPKLAVVLVAAAPWLAIAQWVSRDARSIRASAALWSLIVLLLPAAGLIAWLAMPVYTAGLAIFLALTAATLLVYVVYRNGRVSPDRRILTPSHLGRLLSSKKGSSVAVVGRGKLYGADGKIVFPPDPAESEPTFIKAYNLVQELLYQIVWHRASEAVLSPSQQEHSMAVRFVVDGVASNKQSLSLTDGELVIQYLKPLAGMDANESRRPQKGEVSVDFGTKRTDITVQTAGTTDGQQMQFRITQEVVRQKLDELGMTGEVLARFREMNDRPGVILVSGRNANGVTSTLYSLLRDHDAFTKQMSTLEAKPAIQLENITQNAYGDPSKLPDALADALEGNPDILMVDQVNDARVAKMLLGAAATKTILVGVNAEDSFTALARWVKVCGDAKTAAEHLSGVSCQVLIRKLCPACKEAYRPDPQLLAKANLPANVESFYRPPNKKSCETCQGGGYFQRTAAFELMEVTDEIRQLIASGASLRDIKSACRKNKMLYLQEQALAKVISGVTSIQEVLRVSQPAKK